MNIQEIKNFLEDISKPYVLILVGPPLSGKDTFIKNLGIDLKMVSRDEILLQQSGVDDYNVAFKSVDHKLVDVELKKQFLLSSKEDKVVINMTHMSRKHRVNNLSNFKDHVKVAITLPILEMDEYRVRNDKRKLEEKKYIPEYVIQSMIDSYQPVSEDEGFDKIICFDGK